MDLVGPIIEIVKFVGGPIVRYLTYQINFNDYLKNFKESKEKLQRKQRDIDSRLHSQLVYGKKASEEVKHWLEKVEEITGRVAQDIEDKIEKGGCLLRASGSLAKLLKEKIQEMEGLCEDGSKLPESLVVDDLALAVELKTSELEGGGDVKAAILACLKGGQVTKLGVWGMGGVGKTTIMMHVYNELLKEGKFKKIIWVTVSQNLDIYNLQEQIASSLKEKLEEHQNKINRAAELSKMLEKHNPYLLILDDVWNSFELNEVGIAEPDVTNGCKLVLTTRSQEVARSMDCRSIQVKTLSEDEALKLFLNKVGGAALSCQGGGGIKEDLESTLKEIVDECDGLPLALITVAGSLKGISELRLWRVALNQLRDCKRNVAGTDADAFRTLKFSYDRLENQQIKYCFLYCALYPEDYKIPVEKIIENWIDEGFIDEMESRQSMKDEGYGILRKLEDNSLLEFIEEKHKVDCVRMHDLIRDMALDITRMRPRFLVEAGKALKELPERVHCAEGVEKVSLMHNYIEEISSSLAFSTCMSLTTLLLAHNKLSTISESVFEHMPELKILDLSFNRKLSSLPNSISKLVKLTTMLLESTSLEKVPSLSGLGSLKKLNLKGTKIKEVPEGLGMLKNLECLFLCGSRRDGYHPEIDEIADGVLSDLSKLQELIVNRSKIKLKGDVVRRLMKLEVFHGWFPTMNDMRIFLKYRPNRLSSYFIIVGSNLNAYYTFIDNLPTYEKIMVFKETSIMGENALFPSVQILFIDACHDIRSLNDFSAIKDATDLRRCSIQNCDGMECVLSSWINNPVIQTLEFLHLYNLHKLDELFEANVMVTSSPPPGTFSSLKEVEICKCKKIKKLFPSWKLVECLPSLKKIEVWGCEEMEEIIGSDPKEEGEEGGDIIKKLILPKLKKLSLQNLPALKSICSRRAVMVCDSLQYIRIQDCKKIKKLFPSWKFAEYLPSLESIEVYKCEEMEEIIGSDPEEEGEEGGDIIKKLILPKLKCLGLEHLPALKSICSRRAIMVCDSLHSITIWDCKKIKKLFPSWKFAEYLPSLYGIYVNRCEEMEEIIGSDPKEEGEEGGDIIRKLILPKLKYLRLWKLPALKSICSRRAVMVCDSLESITITDCKGLSRIPLYLPLVDNAQPSPPPSLKTIFIDSEEWWESLEWDHPNAKDVLRPLLNA